MRRFWPGIEQTSSYTTRGLQQWLLAAAMGLVGMMLGAHHAYAVPSFARQTGLACSACHTTFPELTAFGRAFKLHGYTVQGMTELEEPGTDKAPPLTINRAYPLSVMFQTSVTRLNSQQPGAQTANAEFPQALSLFLAGEITPHIGTFMQATYNGNSFNMDNTDIRYADGTQVGGRELLYGITLNNNPTVEDPWQSTPAWGFPFAVPDSGSAPVPGARALLDGTLAQQVAGAGAYTLWDKHWYLAAAAYRSAHIGGPNSPPSDQPFTTSRGANTIRDVAPYWRLAYQENVGVNYFEVGTFGMFAQLFPSTVSGATDKFTDFAFDVQYERPLKQDWLSAHALYIYENQQLDSAHPALASDNHNDKLHTARIDAIYHWRERLTFTLGYFLIRGSNDVTLYAPPAAPQSPQDTVSGSSNGSPDSDGARFEIGYFPWQNVRLSAQYTVYTEFNGRSRNYNGTGRDAMDNNALYLLAWLMY